MSPKMAILVSLLRQRTVWHWIGSFTSMELTSTAAHSQSVPNSVSGTLANFTQ
jgi:hypothetical protein